MRFRGIVVCLLILGALAIGSGYQAIRNIDVNTYRALIASQVETMTGRPVTIAGNVEVSSGANHNVGGVLTLFGGSLAADDDTVKTQSATNPQ
jgi:hypothetical protein